MPLPDPPYLYDDPRLTYDEHCFFYDGGYDNVCLTAPTAVVIYPWQRSGGSKKKTKPYLNVFIRATLVSLNQEEIQLEEGHDWTRFAGEDDPIGIFLNGITIKMDKPYIEGHLKNLINSTTQDDNLKLNLNLVSSETKVPVITTKVLDEDSSAVVELKIIEPYENIKVSCDIIDTTKDSEG